MKNERVYFTKHAHGFAGYTVNLPLIVQAKTFKGLQAKMKRLFKSYLEQLNKLAESEEPFEYVEEQIPYNQIPDNDRDCLPF